MTAGSVKIFLLAKMIAILLDVPANAVMGDIAKIRRAAYKNLHLIFVRYVGPSTYRIFESDEDGAIPKLTDYLSFHRHESKIRVKDAGENIIYLLTPEQFRNSLLETMIGRDPGIEIKVRTWFPFLWGESGPEDDERYSSILRHLRELAEINEA
jgi:hypothetical protein